MSTKLTLFLPLFFLAFLPATVIAQSAPIAGNLSKAESLVLSRIAEGKDANLAEFTNYSDRVLSPTFLQNLFTQDAKDLHVGRRGVQIWDAVVKEDLDLQFIDVPYPVALNSFHFEKTVYFSFSSFRKSINLDGSIFAGPVYFDTTTISGNLLASKTHFTDQKDGVSFASMKVAGRTVFYGSTFDGPARFDSVVMNDLDLRDSLFTSKSDPPSFSDARFGTLNIELATDTGPDWELRFAGQPQVEGMSFERINTSDGSVSSFCLLAKFSPDFYTEVEEYLRKNGDPAKADDLFIAQKQRERRERLHGFSWLTNYFLDIVVGYGRKPQRALYLGVLIVVLGCVVFLREQGMMQRNDKEKSARYSPFWYSLDLFAPVINLNAASNWMPKEERRFARNYVHVHRILGWTLVPIGIAAWTGILK